jgi:GAF domain-containing protein
LVIFLLNKGVAERKQAEESLAQINEKLNISIREQEQRNQEWKLLIEFGDTLQSCISVEEAYKVIPQYIQQLFPSSSGAVFELAASRNLLQAASKWGDSMSSESFFQPEDCRSLRRTRMYQVTGAPSDLLCGHVKQCPPNGYLCVPMMSRGEAFGVFLFGQCFC